MEQDEKQTAVAELLEDFLEEQLWACIVAFQGEPLRTMSGLPYSYTLKEGKHGGLTKELWVDRRENSIFEEQSAEYKESVLPKEVRKRVVVEALSDFGWGKYVGLDGAYVTMKSFGASGPAAKLFEKFGFTVENVVNTVKTLF